MRFRGFDILEPDLARVARGKVPGCSWLTFLGDRVVEAPGAGAVDPALSPRVSVRGIRDGLLLRAGVRPPVGDVESPEGDLEAVREVARLTRPLRPRDRRLCPGTEELSRGWLHRLDG